jgi:hypothetical protein
VHLLTDHPKKKEVEERPYSRLLETEEDDD